MPQSFSHPRYARDADDDDFEDGVLRPGRSMRVAATLMDTAIRDHLRTKFAPDAIQSKVVDACGHAPSGPGYRFLYAPPWELCHLREVTEAARAERSRQLADAWRGDDQSAAGDWNSIKADWEQKLAQATAEDDAEAAREARKAITAMAWRTPPAAFAPEAVSRTAPSVVERRDAVGWTSGPSAASTRSSTAFTPGDTARAQRAAEQAWEQRRQRDLNAWR